MVLISFFYLWQDYGLIDTGAKNMISFTGGVFRYVGAVSKFNCI